MADRDMDLSGSPASTSVNRSRSKSRGARESMSRFNLPSPKENHRTLLGSTFCLALLAFLGAVAVAVLELMEMGEPGQTAEMKTASIGKHSSKIVAVAAAVLQILSIFITVVGYLSNSSLAYVVGSSLTMVTMGVATAAIISEIEDGNTEAANTRYAYMGAVYFFLGFLSGSFSLLSAIRAEVTKLVPVVFTEVDSQTANMLNILAPQQ